MERFEEKIIVNNAHGLHARPAALFVQITNKYDSAVWLKKEEEIVDAKSIIAILSLGIQRGSAVTLIVEGDDAQDAFKELKEFLEKDHE
ncbi:MAG: HPr family phosphocarrier protein [Candidatus Omnitrophica bacterium]|nr:HPr family phosphocarrier protein [Candidatus Omnitrophota bacterium]